MDARQQELVNRLEELKKYQQEQESILQNKQDNQRALLTREQIQMYEMLGLSVSNFAEVSSEPLNVESENENDFEEITYNEDPDGAILSSDEDSVSHVNNYNNELVNNDKVISPLKNIDEFQDEENAAQVPKKPFLKRGSGLTSRFRIPPDAFNLKKLPKYKYADRIKKTLAKKSPKVVETVKSKSENVKKSVKEPETVKNSVKVPENDSTELVPPKVTLKISYEPAKPEPEPKIQDWFNSRVKTTQPGISETPKTVKLPKGVSWAQILSSNNILDSPVKIDHLINPAELESDLDLNETSLFHLLEERVNNMSLDTSMSSLMKLIASLQKQPSSDDTTLVNPEDLNSVNLQIQPHPKDVNKKIIIDDTTEDEEEHHVRFADDVEVVDETTDLSTDVDAIELSQTSTPHERERFKDFKKKLLGHKKPLPEEREDLKEKSDQMKRKLEDLEAEINFLRQQNETVAKLKQDLELDKIQLENDREDMLEQMKDDRIRMELQLHDERLKIEQEKQKLEKALKTPSKKDREEIAKLKDTIEELKEELKTKEVRHGSTSARYRSQIKQLEKENQSLKLELDVVKKDNKKLELENARLRKDTNNKMLQEINRNIAKLAPQEVESQPVLRKSDPVMKKRVKSVAKSSSDEEDEEAPSTHNRKSTKENNPLRTRRSEPLRTSTVKPSSEVLDEMKREIVNSDGSKDIWYPNGNLKKISPDGMLIRMLYFNKDIKETNINEGTVKYYYNETNTWHTTYIDGLEILEYPDGQIEHRYKDGSVEVHYQNGSIRMTNPNWTDETKEEWRLSDGTNIKIMNNDTKILMFANGQREIHTPNHKRREYPDGTVKLAYEDGSFETRYSNGRVRIKDSKGNLISDTMTTMN